MSFRSIFEMAEPSEGSKRMDSGFRPLQGVGHSTKLEGGTHARFLGYCPFAIENDMAKQTVKPF